MKHFKSNWKTFFGKESLHWKEYYLFLKPPWIFNRYGHRSLWMTTLLVFGLFTGMYGQETWTGADNGDWADNDNWADNSAPVGGVINGVLTIQNGAPNAPTSNIPGNITATKMEVMSPFTIPATTTVNIDGTGLTDDGVITQNSGDLTILGTLNVNNVNMNGLEIGSGGTQLFNFGTISVNNSGAAGMLLTGSGSSLNQGNFSIDQSGTNGLIVAGAGTLVNFDNQNTLIITNSAMSAIANSDSIENSGIITVYTVSGGHGVLNSGFFINDSSAVLTVNNVSMDGINTSGTFFNDAARMNIGNGTITGIQDNGIEVTGGTFTNNDTNAPNGGGKIVISGVQGDGIELAAGSVFFNGADVNPDTLWIDNVNGSGLNLTGGTLTNSDTSLIEIGFNGGGIVNKALTGTGSSVNTNAMMRLNGNTGSSDLVGNFFNSGSCALVEITGPTSFSPGSSNSAIIKSSAAASSITGSITNTGLIIDPNNSFNSNLTTRTAQVPVANNNGIIVAPYSAMCYTDTIENFLITALGDPSTSSYLPNSPFTMSGNTNAAILDAANNRLILQMVQSLMDFTYDVNLNGSNCGVSGTVSLSFDNLPTTDLACVGQLQWSLGTDCRAHITPEKLLSGGLVCTDGYTIGLMGGTMGDTLFLDSSHLGQTLQVMVSNPLGNSCWTSLVVEDKSPPVLFCTDTFVYCGQSMDPNVLGFPTAIDPCGGNITFSYVDTENNLGACGNNPDDPDTLRSITRIFTAFDQFHNSATCTQTILVLRPTMDSIRFPDSLTGSNALQCVGGTTIVPDPAVTGRPYAVINGDTILVDATCNFGVSMSDTRTSLGCTGKVRIERIWTVMDWCHLTAGGAIQTYTQLIDIRDTIAPAYTLFPDTVEVVSTFDSTKVTLLANNIHKCMANILPPRLQNASDNCSGVSYRILGPTGTIYNNPLDSFVNVPFGTNTLEYIISDSCGNEVRDTVTFILRDTEMPTLLLNNNVTVVLNNATSTWVNASVFDAGSTDNCQLDSFLIKKSDADTFALMVEFSCADRTLDSVIVRAVDTSGNACIARVGVRVTDQKGHCGSGVISFEGDDDESDTKEDDSNTGDATGNDSTETDPAPSQFATIAGHIRNENGEMVELVEINIDGYEMSPIMTGTNGSFEFEEIPLEKDYMIVPGKNSNYGNGISTYDIVLLNKHILGLRPLDSPYKLIAGDINNSGGITAFDMVLLRQVILGIRTEFPNNKSWRFIDAAYQFKQPENPFADDFPEEYEIINLEEDMRTLDFIGVKIGDLNNNAIANRMLSAGGRHSKESLVFQVVDQAGIVGEKVKVDFTSANFKSILGYQFSLEFDAHALKFDQLSISKHAGFENFNLADIHRGIITTSWNRAEPITLSADEVLFSLEFTVKKPTRIADALTIGSARTPAEAYSGTAQILNVDFQAIDKPDVKEIRLYQNKPNPFTGETTIVFDLPGDDFATLTIFDLSGKIIKTVADHYRKGRNQIVIDGQSFPTQGMLYYRLATENSIKTKKMILLK